MTAIAAIGNPQRFFDTVKGLGIDAKAVAFDDHHAFEARDFLASPQDIIVMTAKDAVKCTHFANEYCWALEVSLQLPDQLIHDILPLMGQAGR